MTDTNQVRLDKWLWAARFYKTRSLAKTAIEGGKVHYNSARCKPGKIVETGASIRLRVGWDEKTIIILAITDKRRGAPEAQALYQETPESEAKREMQKQARQGMNQAMAASAGRPSKKQRRDILRAKHDYSQED